MKTEVISVSPSTPITEAAFIMREENIGSLVVIDDKSRLVGIITDRDIVVSVVAELSNLASALSCTSKVI